MISSFKAVLTKQHNFLIRKSLGKGVLVTILGSSLFSLTSLAVIFLRSSNFHIDIGVFFGLGITWIFAFVLTLLPITFCIALLTFRLQSGIFQNQNTIWKFVMEGIVLGGMISLTIGGFVSFLNLLLIESIGKGSMIGVTLFTIEGVFVGVILGGITAFFLSKGQIEYNN